MSYFSNSVGDPSQGEKFVWSPQFPEPVQSPLSPLSEITTRSGRSKRKGVNVSRPWRHSISHHILSSEHAPTSSTVRQFRPGRQRKRLFVAAFIQWLVTLFFCVLLGLILWGFSQLQLMQVWQIKTFNALMVLGSLWLGNNLTGSLKEYAMMMRWRVLGLKFRPLHEADLLMHCESLRKVLKLLWIARPSSGWGVSPTQVGCILWLGINLMLAVLVALLGLTYNMETAQIPALMYGNVSIANLTLVRDVWADENPTFSAQLGAAQSFGIQGQDYNFTDDGVPGQAGQLPVFGSPYTPNIYAVNDWTEMRYYFMDLNTDNPNLSVLSRRYVAVNTNCTKFPLLSGGNGTNAHITYTDLRVNKNITIDVVRVGPGATTYISALNSTCGSRCTEVYALQSAGDPRIPSPSFYQCNTTISPVYGIEPDYAVHPDHIAEYTLADEQARIFAGAIGWSGFNYSADDNYQYVRYAVDSWWSPSNPTNISQLAGHISEFAIEGVAAMDNNGDRIITQGWYPVPSQIVSVDWKWAAILLAVIPALHFGAMVVVIVWAGQAIIRDESCISIAKLWGPVVGRLGNHGCLLTGEEMCEQLGNIKVKYGVSKSLSADAAGAGAAHTRGNHLQEEQREADVMAGLRFENQIVGPQVRHVGMIEEEETGVVQWQTGDGDGVVKGRGGGRRGSVWQRTQVEFPEGLYDGEGNGLDASLGYSSSRREEAKRKLLRRRVRRVGKS